MFVTASFNPDLIPKPKLTELPPEGAAPAATSTPPAATPAKTDEPKKEPAPKQEEPKPADAPKKDDPKTPTKVDADDASGCDQEPAKSDDAEKKPEPKPSATPTVTPSATKPAEPAKPAPTATPSATKPAEAAKPEEKPAEPPKPPMTAEERKRIETENKEKQAKYEADLKAGEEKAKKLNAQFADWFYVVSDTTFQGLNIDPTTLLKKPTPPATNPSGPPAGFPGIGLPPGLNLPQP